MKSHRNAILAVILPDKQGNYEYALKSNTCCETGCTTYIRDWMFTIIKENLFNQNKRTLLVVKIIPEFGMVNIATFLWSDGIILNLMLPQ